MRIGNLPEPCARVEENKWYVWFEFHKCPPYMFGTFKPYFFFGCYKVLDHGEPHLWDGAPRKEAGFFKRWVFPWGISIRIE